MSARFLATCLVLVGCGGIDAFQPVYPDNRAADLAEVRARLAGASPSSTNVAVGLTAEPHRLYAVELPSGRELWERPVEDPQTAPSIAGALVVLHEGERIVGRRLADGAVAFSVSDQRLSLVGAAGEGDLSVVVLSTTGTVGAQSHLLFAGPGGVRTQAQIEAALGAPAVAGGLAFVPWSQQNVSVLDGESGAEVARVLSHAGVIGHARVVGSELYFGQAGIGRLGEGAQQGPAEIGWYQPEGELPGDAPLFRSAYDPPANARSATHRIGLVYRPSGVSGGSVSFADDTLYLTFYRFVFGLRPSDLSVRWVHRHDADVVGAEAVEGGLIVGDASGGFAFLNAAGALTWSEHSEREPTVVRFQLGSFSPPGGAGAALPPLTEQLLAAAQDSDARLVPGREFAVRALAGQPDPEVTTHLIVLCEDRAVPDRVRQSACEALSGRETGADVVLAALGRRASFLEGTPAPPVGPLATLAARLEERRAVPLLIGHLRGPDTPTDALPPLAGALAALGDRSAVAPMQDFLWLYHADEDEALASGVAAVARALIVLAGPSGREDVREVLDAPFTSGPLRDRLTALLAETTEDQPEGE